MYQDNNYNSENNYTGNSQYGYGDSSSYGDAYRTVYETPRPKKKSNIGKIMAAVALTGILVGVGGVGGFLISERNHGVNTYQKNEIIEEVKPIDQVAEEKKELQQDGEQSNTAEAALLPESQSGIESTREVATVITDVTNVVDEVMPSVVSITNTSIVTESFFGQQFTSENASSGSGFIVGENENELLIVTNNHVIADSTELKVQFIDESVVNAKIKGTDVSMDLAVIAVSVEDLEKSTIEAISIAALGDSESLKVGEPAIAIGNALGYGQSVTTGVISALDRQIMVEDGSTMGSLIQTDAAINPGNSGGALLNVRGEVVGINSNKMGGSAIEGMGYAIPISKAKPIIEELMSRETKDKVDAARKGYLGISGLDVTSEVSAMYGMPQGVYVAQVYEGGAQTAGMLKGDIITSFDGSTVSTMEDLQGYLEYYEVGTTVLVTVQRPSAGGYIEQTLLVVLGPQTQSP